MASVVIVDVKKKKNENRSDTHCFDCCSSSSGSNCYLSIQCSVIHCFDCCSSLSGSNCYLSIQCSVIHCFDCCSSSGSNCYLSIQCSVVAISKWLPSGTSIQLKINHLPQYYQCFIFVFIMLFLSPIATESIQLYVIKFVSDLWQVSVFLWHSGFLL